MMGTWNYRIVKHRDQKNSYGLHEVYYDTKGKPWGMTENPTSFGGETREELIKALTLALRDAQKKPVLKEPAKGKWPGKDPF